jgi:hypothetical protein
MVMVSSHATGRVKGVEGHAPPGLEYFPTENAPIQQHKSSVCSKTPPKSRNNLIYDQTKQRDCLEQEQEPEPEPEQEHQDYFVTLRVDRHGRPRFHSSSALKQHEEYILGGAYERLLECVPELSNTNLGNGG